MAVVEGDTRLAQLASDQMIEMNPPTPDEWATMVLARTALWAGDAELAGHALELNRQARTHGPAVDATRIAISAGLAALAGKQDEARTAYRAVLRTWRDMGLVFDEVLTVIDMATLLDPSDPEVLAVAATARETLVRLVAKPLLARLDAAVARGKPPVTVTIDVDQAARTGSASVS
jgi:hypothetical protein